MGKDILITGFKGGSGKTVVARALTHVAQNEGLDVNIQDGLSRLTCGMRSMIGRADYVIVVEEPGVFGQLDMVFSLKEIKKHDASCGVILNKADLVEDRDFHRLLKENEVPLLGSFPFNRYTAFILAEGKNLAEEINDVYRQCREILDRIMQEVE